MIPRLSLLWSVVFLSLRQIINTFQFTVQSIRLSLKNELLIRWYQKPYWTDYPGGSSMCKWKIRIVDGSPLLNFIILSQSEIFSVFNYQ